MDSLDLSGSSNWEPGGASHKQPASRRVTIAESSALPAQAALRGHAADKNRRKSARPAQDQLRSGSVWRSEAPPSLTRPPRPTYQLLPAAGEKIVGTEQLRLELQGLLEDLLSLEVYHPTTAPRLCHVISDAIKACLKETNAPRYKLVVLASITSAARGQTGVITTSRCLWDTVTDSSFDVTYSNASLYAAATIYTIYFD